MAVLLRDKHISYLHDIGNRTDELDFWLKEHLHVSAIYWSCMSFWLLKKKDQIDKERIVSFLLSCLTESGGFACYPGHDDHITNTVYAVQVLAMLDSLHVIDKDKVASYIIGLQNEDGSMKGDRWGEIDARFLYSGINCLAILGKLDYLNKNTAVDWLMKCYNFDGGFGLCPGAESHGAMGMFNFKTQLLT